jgi:hypothetical protein
MTQWENVTDDPDFHPFGAHDDGGGGDVTRGLDIDRGEVVLVNKGAVEAEIFVTVRGSQKRLVNRTSGPNSGGTAG